MTAKWTTAVAAVRRASNGFAPDVGQRPAPQHLVTVTEQHDDATITYAASCTCGHYVRTDTEGETRYAARLHAAGTVFAGGRPQFPMRLVINGKVQ